MQNIATKIDLNAAKEELKKLGQGSDEFSSEYFDGIDNFNLKQYVHAIQSFEKTITKIHVQFGEGQNIHEALIYKWMANAYWYLSDLENAKKSIKKTIKIYKKLLKEDEQRALAEAYGIKGQILFDMEECLTSVRSWQKQHAILDKILGDDDKYELGQVLCNIGKAYSSARSEDAKNSFEKAIDMLTLGIGIKDCADAEVLIATALFQDFENKFSDAVENFRLALQHYEQAGDHQRIGDVCFQMGKALYYSEQYEEALYYFKKAEPYFNEFYGSNHFYSGFLLSWILYSQRLAKQPKEAAETSKKVLERFGVIISFPFRSSVNALTSAGEAFRVMDNMDDAFKAFTKALEIAKRFGDENEKVASTYTDLGNLYWYESKLDQCLEAYQKAYDLYVKLGDERCVEMTTLNLGNVYWFQGKFDKAMDSYKRALEMYRKKHEKEDETVAPYYNNIGNIYCDQGDNQTGLENYKKAYDIFVEKKGADHPNAALYHYQMARGLSRIGAYQKARQFIEKSLDIDIKYCGDSNSAVGKTLSLLGLVLIEQDKPKEAITYLEKAIQNMENQTYPNNYHISNAYQRLGLAYLKLKEYDSAMNNIVKALSLKLTQFGEDHPWTAEAYYALGQVFKAKQNHEEALINFEKALSIRKKFFNDDHPDVHQNQLSVNATKKKL